MSHCVITVFSTSCFQFYVLDSEPQTDKVFTIEERDFQFYVLDSVCSRFRARPRIYHFQFYVLDSIPKELGEKLARMADFQFYVLDSARYGRDDSFMITMAFNSMF